VNALLGSIPATNRRVPHISLVFREMWDTGNLPLKPVAGAGSRRVPLAPGLTLFRSLLDRLPFFR
jgi:hypothetical protein